MEPNASREAAARCAELLENGDLHGALRYLNGRTRHRFTAVYRFDPPWLRNVCQFDRENPGVKAGGDALMKDTYCSIIDVQQAPFTTGDAMEDPRLADHPGRMRFQAYCGFPLYDERGTCVGTLCHFDPRPRVIPADEFSSCSRALPR